MPSSSSSSSENSPTFYLLLLLVLVTILTYTTFGSSTPTTTSSSSSSTASNSNHNPLSSLLDENNDVNQNNNNNNNNHVNDDQFIQAETPSSNMNYNSVPKRSPPSTPSPPKQQIQLERQKQEQKIFNEKIETVVARPSSNPNLIINSEKTFTEIRETISSSSSQNMMRSLYPITTTNYNPQGVFDFPEHITEIAIEGGTNIRAELTDWVCGGYDTLWERDGTHKNKFETMYTHSVHAIKRRLTSTRNRALITAEPIPKAYNDMVNAVGETCSKAFFADEKEMFKKDSAIIRTKLAKKIYKYTKEVYVSVNPTRVKKTLSIMLGKQSSTSTDAATNLPVLLPLNIAFAPTHSIFPLHLSQLSACSSLNTLNNDYSKHVIGKESKMMAKVDAVCSQNAQQGGKTLKVPTVPLFDLIAKIPERVRVTVVAIDAQGFDWPVMQSLLPQKQFLRVANLVAECQDLPVDHASFITKGAISCSEMISCVGKYFSSSFEFVKCRENNERSREFNCLWTNRRLVKVVDQDESSSLLLTRKNKYDYSESDIDAIEAALGHGRDSTRLDHVNQVCRTSKLLV